MDPAWAAWVAGSADILVPRPPASSPPSAGRSRTVALLPSVVTFGRRQARLDIRIRTLEAKLAGGSQWCTLARISIFLLNTGQ
jgi:hypothetical protein